MDLKALIEKIAAENSQVPAAKVKSIIRAAFEGLRAELSTAEVGRVQTPLGSVRIAIKDRKSKTTGEIEQRRTYGLRLAKSSEEIQATLTPEQKAKREAMRAERKAKKAAA